MYNLSHYTNSMCTDIRSIQFEAYLAEGDNKFIELIKTWVEKITGFFTRIKEFVVKIFKKIREMFQKKLFGRKESDDVPSWPEGKAFMDYNYKNFVESDLENLDLIFSNGRYDKSEADKIRASWGCDSDTAKSEDIKKHFLKDKIKIDGSYIPFEDARDIVTNKEYESNILKKLNGMNDECERIGTRLIKDIGGNSDNGKQQKASISKELTNNAVLVNTITSIISSYISQLKDILKVYVSTITKRNEEYHLSSDFYQSVAARNVLLIRIMVKNSMLVDPSFRQCDAMLKEAESVPGLYDKHDGTKLETDRSKWTVDYENELLVQVVDNFSHERINHLKQVVTYVENKVRTKKGKGKE